MDGAIIPGGGGVVWLGQNAFGIGVMSVLLGVFGEYFPFPSRYHLTALPQVPAYRDRAREMATGQMGKIG